MPHRWRRIGVLVFFAIVGTLVFRRARTFDWARILHTLQGLEPRTIMLASASTAASYLAYSFVDWFARDYTGLGLSRRLLMAIAFVCYSFNQNLGSLVGSVGFRLRLYSRFGVDPARIGGIVGLSLVTNWSGYFFVAGLAFLARFATLPRSWTLGALALQVLGGVMLVIGVTFLGLCAFSPRRSWTVRGRELGLPRVGTACAQIALSSSNWLLMATTVWLLFRGQVPFPQLLAVFLFSCVAGAATHVPAGLGVIEAVFLAMLGTSVPRHEILASLLAYRGIYYLGPLAVAAAGYALLEMRARRVHRPGGGAVEPEKRAAETSAAAPKRTIRVTVKPGAEQTMLERPDAAGRRE